MNDSFNDLLKPDARTLRQFGFIALAGYGFLAEKDQVFLRIALQNMRMSCDSTYLLDQSTDHGNKADEMMQLLAEVFEELAGRGVMVMLSNSDVSWIHKRYAGFGIRVVKANRFVNSNSRRRGPVGEVVVTSY